MATNQTQIRISAVDATRQAFQSVQSNISGLSSSVRNLAGILATAFAGLGLANTIKETAAYSKEIDRLAQLSGLSVERFQALAYGAERVGVSTEKLADIFKDTQDKVGDFIQTGGGALADFFENIAPRVGVTAQQFQKLNGKDALQLYVDSLQRANVSQNDFIFYLEAIASDSALLLPLLRNNGEAFGLLADEAEHLGVILSQDAIKQAREFADNLSRLDKLSTALGQSLGNAIIPTLNKIATVLLAINKVAKEEGGFLMTLLKMTEIAELFGSKVNEKVVKAAQEIEQANNRVQKSLAGTTSQLNDIVIVASDFKNETAQLAEVTKDIVQIYNETRSPVDQLSDRLAHLNYLYDTGRISLEMLQEASLNANEKFERTQNTIQNSSSALLEYVNSIKTVQDALDVGAVNAISGLEDTLTGLIMGTVKTKDAFKSMAASIIADLTRIVIQRSITGPLAELLFSSLPGFGGGTGGGFAGGGFGSVGTRAIGGPVQSGSPYMVGERGAELFVPNTSGTIVPSNQLGAGGVTINQTLNIDASADRAGIQRALELNRRQTISEINDLMRRNSPALARM